MKMIFENLIKLIKKKGFLDTYEVLLSFKTHEADMHEFYEELLKFSYYNSFMRVKAELINKGLIKIERVNDSRKISLTKKGYNVCGILNHLELFIDDFEKLNIKKNEQMEGLINGF